jgi:uncharacterized protein YjbI with pentapeptide repeats
MRFVNDSGLRACWFVGRVPPHRLSATFLVKGTFRLRHGQTVEPLPFDEQEDPTGDVFRDDDPARALLYPSDFALVKPRADATLVGSFHAPQGKPVRASTVTFAINSWSKKLAVVGDRDRQEGVIGYTTGPEPFVRMEISWERTFGGPGHAGNPLGRGVQPSVRAGGPTVIPMPNVGTVDKMFHDSGPAAPASFAPVPLAWAERTRKAGTFDATWLEERWPWFPKDVDWSIFNAAPRDQQFEFFKGDEKLGLENLHPTHSVLETWLPGMRPRFFARREGGAGPEFFEIPLRLDTLHVDAGQEKLSLVWRGLSEIRSKEMKEYLDFYVVSEGLKAAPAALEHHAIEFDRRTAKPAEPAPSKWPLIEESAVRQPSVDWVAGAEKQAARVEADAVAFEAEVNAQRKGVEEMLRRQGLTLPLPSTSPVAPASLPSSADLLARALQQHALLEKIAPAVAAKLPAPRLADFEPPMIEAPPPEAPGIPDLPVVRRWTRAECEAHARAQGSFAGETLAGLDLSGLDLHGLDLRGAMLKSATLVKANLSGANLRGAVLSGADLTEINLRHAALEQADFTKADLTRADLRQAVMNTAEFGEARMIEARLDGARAEEAIFRGADLTGAVLREGSFDLADFDDSVLHGADVTNAGLTSASFEGAQATGVRASGARLSRAKAAHADFRGSVFHKADAEGSIWEEANLEGADFQDAFLRSANFAGASLRKARLYRTDLKHARLPGAVLEEADVSQVNLFRGTLEGARLSHADFRGSNLFEVEFYETQWKGAAFTGANLKGSKLDGKS